MRFFQTWFWTALRGQLTEWRTWLLLLLLPLLALGADRLIPAEEVSAPVQVGVVLPEEGGGRFWSLLEERSGLVVTFQLSDEDTARRQVATGQWDCALLLPEDFEDRLERLELYPALTLLTGPGSTVYPMVRETAAAALAQCVSPGIAERYLLRSGIAGQDTIAEMRPRLNEVLLDQDRVLVSMETADGRPLDAIELADSGRSQLLTGLAAILLLIWALLLAMDLGRWLDSPFACRLVPLRGRTRLLLPRLGAGLVPALLSGCLALLAVGQPGGLLPLLPYLLLWGGAGALMARRRAVWSALPVLLPFVPAAGLLLSPALLDLSQLFPVLAPVVRWNPVTLYLRAGAGSWRDGLLLTGLAAAVLLLNLLPAPKSRSRAQPA